MTACARAVLACALGVVGIARAEQLPVRTYGTSAGMSSSRVTGIASDTRGFLWLATVDGLNRFDGERFESFGVADGLPDPSCLAVRVMSDGAIWVATEHGVARLDPDTASVGPRFTATHVGTTPADDVVLAIFEDDRHQRWLGTEGGLWRVEADGTIAAVALRPGRQPRVYAIAEDAARSLWLGTSSGLVHRTADGHVEQYRVDAIDNRIRSVYVDRGGRLWVAAAVRGMLALVPPVPGTRLGVADPVTLWDAAGSALADDQTIRLPRTLGEIIRYGPDVGFPDGMWWGIREDARGHMWFGARHAVRFDGRQFVELDASHGFPDDALAPAVEDRAGNLWFGSQTSGAVRLAPRGLVTFDTRDGLGTNHVSAVMADPSGTLHVVTHANGHVLNRMDGNRFVAVHPRLPDRIPDHNGWGTTQIEFVDRDGRWWYATQYGVARYPRVARIDDLATTEPEFFAVAEGLPGHDVLRMFEDSRGDVWIATMSETGVARWDRAGNRIVTVADPALPSPVYAFAEDRAGGVWLGHDDGRLVRLPRGDVHGARVFGTADGLPGRSIMALLLDRAGRLWVATNGGGVLRFDDPHTDAPRLTRYTIANGMATDLVLALVEDARGRIYAGTMRGVDRIDPETGAIAGISAADGLPQDFVQDGFRDRAGTLWFATSRGVARLVPDDDRVVAPPIVYLMALRAGGTMRPLAVGGARSSPAISLDASEGQLDIEFTSPSFESGLPVAFEYRLDGADHEWNTAVGNRRVLYANLAPGNYQFQVRARYPGGAPSEPATFAVEVRPPLWRRPWFIALVAALIALAGWRLYRWRVEHLIAVERVRTRIATDLHDDLGASLSRISILAEVAARRSTGDRTVGDVVDDIGRSARDLVDVASDIVWSTDPTRDDLGSLLVRLRSFAGDILEGRGIAWSLDGPSDPSRIKLDPDQRRHFHLVVKEAIHNAARHSGARRVTIDVQHHAHELAVVIEDDGSGIDPARPATGNGLRNMRARAQQARGTLEIDAPASGGTRVTLRIPI